MRVLTTKGWVTPRERSADWVDHFLYQGQPHNLGGEGVQTTLGGSPAESTPDSFARTVDMVNRRSGPVGAAVLARQSVMASLRPMWRRRRNGRPGELVGTSSLALFERPSAHMSRDGWLRRCEADVSFAGNSFTWRHDGQLHRLRPDWVDVLLGGEWPAVEVVGYAVYRGGDRSGRPRILGVGEVAHWAPDPHPLNTFIGQSWITAVLQEILTDGQATDHVSKFFDNAATANMVVRAADGVTQTQFKEWVKEFEKEHAGGQWRNLYVSPGTDVTVVGSKLGDLDLRGVVGGFENRVVMKSRVPAVILGSREGQQGSALNSGNYAATRRTWADTWYDTYAQSWCDAHAPLVVAPGPDVELTHDRSQSLFLQEDQKDAADILQAKASAIETLFRSGFDPDSAVEAVTAGDLTLLAGSHNGLPSVQTNVEAPGDGVG